MSTRAPESAGEVQTAGTRAPPAVRLVSLRKRYGKVDAVAGVDLAVAEGEFFTLLGPSGSGKTSLLRLIAGFERPDSGRVELAGQDVTFRPPYARDVNTVFQDYALFPHMTVADNIEYGLRVKRVPKAKRRERVEQVLATVRLSGHGGRKPLQLSGGQRARRARPETPPGDAARAEAHPGAGGHHVPLRDPRPGGGAHHERPGRHPAGWPHRAGWHPGRGVRAALQRFRRRVHRRLEPDRAGRQARHRPPGEDPHPGRCPAARARSARRARGDPGGHLPRRGHPLRRGPRGRGPAGGGAAEPRRGGRADPEEEA